MQDVTVHLDHTVVVGTRYHDFLPEGASPRRDTHRVCDDALWLTVGVVSVDVPPLGKWRGYVDGDPERGRGRTREQYVAAAGDCGAGRAPGDRVPPLSRLHGELTGRHRLAGTLRTDRVGGHDPGRAETVEHLKVPQLAVLVRDRPVHRDVKRAVVPEPTTDQVPVGGT